MSKFDGISTYCLPDSVQRIADVIGLSATEQLVKAIGGARFKFGKGKHNTARLVLLKQAIGIEATEKLLEVFGGDEIYVPRCQVALQRLHNRQFQADYAALTEDGKTSKAMAYLQLLPQYGISNRTADAILQQRETRIQQGILF